MALYGKYSNILCRLLLWFPDDTASCTFCNVYLCWHIHVCLIMISLLNMSLNEMLEFSICSRVVYCGKIYLLANRTLSMARSVQPLLKIDTETIPLVWCVFSVWKTVKHRRIFYSKCRNLEKWISVTSSWLPHQYGWMEIVWHQLVVLCNKATDWLVFVVCRGSRLHYSFYGRLIVTTKITGRFTMKLSPVVCSVQPNFAVTAN